MEATLRIKGKMFNITIICVYAPTEETEEQRKEKLENNEAAPRHDIKLVL